MAEDIVYTPTEAAKLLKLSKVYVYRLIAQGKIPIIRIGRRVLIPKAELLEWLRERVINKEDWTR